MSVSDDPTLGRPVEGAPDVPPRLAPDAAFPPYRFVPGKAPHPFAHEGGWGYGTERPVPPYTPPERWRECTNYLYGVDLFNAGWWWEAHETWEELWHVTQAESEGWTDLLKGLIQLAACSLNRERGVHGGANRLLVTAVQCLERVRDRDAVDGRFCGLDVAWLIDAAREHLTDEAPAKPGLFLRPA